MSISDEGRWASVTALDETMDGIAPHLDEGAMVVLRNTVYPGTTTRIRERLATQGIRVDVVFCPERMVQGNALEELQSLPQIVGADDDRSAARAAALFRRLGVDTVQSSAVEAELAKLVANGWRYISFAAANQFWMLADAAGVDYDNVLRVVRQDYPRAQGLPGPGFAAGPCLVKDMVALASFAGTDGALLRAALEINGELPARIVADMQQRFGSLSGRQVGLLGMSFKAGSDDTRGAPSTRLGELLSLAGATVLRTDPYVRDLRNLPLERRFEAFRDRGGGHAPRRLPRAGRARGPAGRPLGCHAGWDRHLTVSSTLAGRGGHALLLVQNLPVPFDRRVWAEAKALVADGWRVSSSAPVLRGRRGTSVRDGVEIYRYPMAVSARDCWDTFVSTRWPSVARDPGGSGTHAAACRRLSCRQPAGFLFPLAMFLRGRGAAVCVRPARSGARAVVAQGGHRGGLVERFLRWCERQTYLAADVVIATNESVREIATRRGRVDPARVVVVRSAVDTSRTYRVDPDHQLKAGRRFLVVYLGVMGPQDGIDLFVRAARVMCDLMPGAIRFLAIGDGSERVRARDAGRAAASGRATSTSRAR